MNMKLWHVIGLAAFLFSSTGYASYPTDKDQCKNGGWKAFGFKNQGQCIKVVQRGSKQWNLASDFQIAPNQENPNPDSYGNSNVWYFMESPTLEHNPATYSLLPEFIPDAFNIPGLEQWQDSSSYDPAFLGKDRLPAVGINATGEFQSSILPWPAGAIRMHPYENKMAIIGWQSPISGLIDVETTFKSVYNPGIGGRILWSVDKGATTLATGSTQYGTQTFLSNIQVNKSDFLYFTVDPGNDSYFGDSTLIDVNITTHIDD